MLKIIKYKNHGICMHGGEEEEHHEKLLNLKNHFFQTLRKVNPIKAASYLNPKHKAFDYKEFYTYYYLDYSKYLSKKQ